MDQQIYLYIIAGMAALLLLFWITRRRVKVIDVVDGDTIEIQFGIPPFGCDKTEKLRFIGVDTPETKHPRKGKQRYGKEAFAYTRDKLLNKKVGLKFDKNRRDKYGRLLGYIYLGSKMFNADLIRKGYARAYLSYPFAYKKRFKKLEDQAKSEHRGLWKRKGKKIGLLALLSLLLAAGGIYLFLFSGIL